MAVPTVDDRLERFAWRMAWVGASIYALAVALAAAVSVVPKVGSLRWSLVGLASAARFGVPVVLVALARRRPGLLTTAGVLGMTIGLWPLGGYRVLGVPFTIAGVMLVIAGRRVQNGGSAAREVAATIAAVVLLGLSGIAVSTAGVTCASHGVEVGAPLRRPACSGGPTAFNGAASIALTALAVGVALSGHSRATIRRASPSGRIDG